MSSASDSVAPAKKIEFDDPHAGIGNLQEAEVTRVRTLRGGWRWALVVATAATILLCINQQFSLRFFIGYTQLNTEYFYLLIALMLPFTFLIFPGTESAALDRIPWYDLLLFLATFGASIWLMLNVRKAAQFGWESDGAPQNVIAAGLVMWFVLMEALRRTGGWSLLLSVLPFTVYPLFAEAVMARAVPGIAAHARPDHRLSRVVGREPARHSDSGLRRHGDRLPRVRHRADDDRRRQILHQHRLCAVRHLSWRRGESLHLRQRPARHDVGLDHLQRADRRHHDHSGHEEERLPRLLCRRDRGLRLDRRGAGAAGDGRDRVRDRAIPQRQLRRCRGRRDHPGGAVLCRPVHAGGFLRRPAWPEGHSARRAAEDLGYDQGRLVLHLRHRAADRDAAVFQAREPRAVLRDRAAAGAEPAVLQGDPLDARDHQQVPRSQRPHLRRTGRHPRRLRPADRRVLDDRRGLEPRQRSAAASPATTPSCCSACAPSPASFSGSG